MLELQPNLLWTDYESMSVLGLPLGRRVAIARGAAGELLVFSPLKLSASTEAELKKLGSIAAFVLPNRVHDLSYDQYFTAFSNSRFLAGPASIADHTTWPLTRIQADLPELQGFSYELLQGMPRVQEHLFLHHASKTLIIADALFNLPVSRIWWQRILMNIADMGGKPRPSRLFQSMIRSRTDFSTSLGKIFEWDFDRIIPGHGEIVEHDGKQIMREAFHAYLS